MIMDKTSYRVLTLTVGFMLLLSTTAQQVIAWTPCPPPRPPCHTCTPTGWENDCGAGQTCCGGSCCSNTCCNGVCCGSGQSCCGGECCNPDDCCNGECCPGGCCEDSDCTGECHNGCSNCQCVDDDIKCSSIDCETCNEGVCEDECPALGKHCWYGECVECRDILDCELCYECENHECVHPCDECYYPKYCGYACACVECYPGPDDTTTCSGEDGDECTGCTEWPISPCSGAGDIIVYTNNSLTTCTGTDCETRQDVLCYTTYDQCEAEEWIPFFWCKYNVPGPDTCSFDIEHPIGPGCWPCVIDEGSADPTYGTRGICPTEAWP